MAGKVTVTLATFTGGFVTAAPDTLVSSIALVDPIIPGSPGDDSIRDMDANATISGRAGNDMIFGGRGNDLLLGNQGDDTLSAAAGNDTIFGGQGHDVLLGNQGQDSVSGDRGNDQLYGGAGSDTLAGGDGDDTLSGDRDADVLYGNRGNDTFLFGTTPKLLDGSIDMIMDFEVGRDKIVVDGDQSLITFADTGDDVTLYYDGIAVAVIVGLTDLPSDPSTLLGSGVVATA